MARKLKVTGFARFFFLLIILTPLAYLIASYANGEDGVQNIKQLIGMEQKAEDGAGAEERTRTYVTKSQDVEDLRAENRELREELRAKEREIHELKREIRILKGSK